MARPARLLFVLVCTAFLVTGCSGADAQRATELLAQAQAAQAGVRSATWDARMSISKGSETYTMLMSGGGYLQGPRAGDQVVNMQSQGLPQQLDVGLVMSHGR